MRIALVHDDIVQWGGAERILLALSEIFPDSPIYTSAIDFSNSIIRENFSNKKIITSFIQNIPGWAGFYKALLPLYPIAFEQFDFTDFDIVISQTTRFAKSILTKPETKHICYCHTPPRFLWNFSGETLPAICKPALNLFRLYDFISSKRVDFWIAGSDNARKRIKRIYHAEPQVIYPFVDTVRFSDFTPFDGGYLLTISRLNRYKRVDLAIQAAMQLKIPLKVIGSGPDMDRLQNMAGDNIDFLGTVSDEKLAYALSGCKALIMAGEEDFGLVALEAQALGKPVVAFGRGGALETIINGQTGYLFPKQTVDSLIGALTKLAKKGYNQARCREQAAKFSKEGFIFEFKKLIN